MVWWRFQGAGAPDRPRRAAQVGLAILALAVLFGEIGFLAHTLEALRRLAALYEAWGRGGDADSWRPR